MITTLILVTLIMALAVLALLPLLARWPKPIVHHRGPVRAKGFRRHWRKLYLLPVGIHRLFGWMPGARFNPVVQFANIGEGTYEDGRRSYLPDAVTASRYLIYKRGTDADHCARAGAGDDPLGSSNDQADDTAVPISIQLFGVARGTVRVVTDGSLSDGDYCKCAANGKATKANTGDLAFGRALIPTDSSKANGDVITVIHELPSKLSF